MKKGRMVSTVLIIMLSTVIFGMSGDGGQQPVAPKKEVVNVSPQESLQGENMEITEQTGLVRESETVKDRLGINTGLTKVDLEKFKIEYNKMDKQMFPGTHTTMLYDAKVDLNKYDELKKLGVDLRRAGVPSEAKTYKENTIYRDIVVIGKTIGPEKVKGVDTFKIEISEILKGADILKSKLGEVPQYFNYYDPFTPEPILNRMGLYFFDFAFRIDPVTHRWIQQVTGSTLILLDDSTVMIEKFADTANRKPFTPGGLNPAFVYSDDFKRKAKWDEVIQRVKDIVKVNDSENFYKKLFRVKAKVEVENEK